MRRQVDPDSDPYHKNGKRSGYSLPPDGSIGIAPMYSARFDDIISEKAAVSEVLALVTKTAQDRLGAISKRLTALWEELREDIGLDLKQQWYYDGEGYLRRRVAPTAKPKPRAKQSRRKR